MDPVKDGLTRERVAELDKFKKDLQLNNVAAVREKLDSGLFDVNEPFPFPRWTPLMVTAHSCNSELVQILLERGADSNAEIDRYTVLHAAIASQTDDSETEKCARLLLAGGANVNALGCLQLTAIMYAAKSNKIQTMRSLLECGADINAQCSRGYTALMYAATNGHAQATAFLLKRGADPELSAFPSSVKSEVRPQCEASNDSEPSGSSATPRRVALQLVDERLANPNLSDTLRERLLETRSLLRRHTNTFRDQSASEKSCSLESHLASSSDCNEKSNVTLQRANVAESQRRLVNFLKELNLAHLRALTDGRRVTFAALLSSDDVQLREQFGVTDEAERRKLLIAIRNVHEAAFADESLPFAARIRRFAARCDRDVAVAADANGSEAGRSAKPSIRERETELYDIESSLSATDLLGIVRNVLVHSELLDSALRFVENQLSAGANVSSVPVFATQRNDVMTVALLDEALRLAFANSQNLRTTAERLVNAFAQLRGTFDLSSPDLLVRVTRRDDQNTSAGCLVKNSAERKSGCTLRRFVCGSCAVLAVATVCTAAFVLRLRRNPNVRLLDALRIVRC